MDDNSGISLTIASKMFVCRLSVLCRRDLNSFLNDVEDGSFIQMNSLEAIFIDEDGKQLLVSSAL